MTHLDGRNGIHGINGDRLEELNAKNREHSDAIS